MLNDTDIISTIKNACAKIAPLWPLENFVGVNPFWAFNDISFEKAAGLLEKTGVRMTMPLSI